VYPGGQYVGRELILQDIEWVIFNLRHVSQSARMSAERYNPVTV
jgi:hypothetical protein